MSSSASRNRRWASPRRQRRGGHDRHRAAHLRIRSGVVPDRCARERAVRHGDLHAIVREQAGRAPVDLDHLRGVRRVRIELHPVPHREGLLRLDREACEEVAQCLLQRETDHGGHERGAGEQGARLHPGGAQHHESDRGVQRALHDLLQDSRQGRTPLPLVERVQDDERGTGDRAEDRGERDEMQEGIDVAVGDLLAQRVERREDDEERRGKAQLLSLVGTDERGGQPEQRDRPEQPQPVEGVGVEVVVQRFPARHPRVVRRGAARRVRIRRSWEPTELAARRRWRLIRLRRPRRSGRGEAAPLRPQETASTRSVRAARRGSPGSSR